MSYEIQMCDSCHLVYKLHALIFVFKIGMTQYKVDSKILVNNTVLIFLHLK